MATTDEKRAAVERIRAYCREYTGKHRAYFDRLLNILAESEGLRDQEDAGLRDPGARLEAQYRTAVSMLILLAERPNIATLHAALQRINQRAKTNFTDVQLVGGPRDGELLSELLRKPQKRSQVRSEVLTKLRHTLVSDYAPFRRRG
jgi:hypothetical protein